MFSIFEKKGYLSDHLNGFTDIHNHILPGIDDGASGVEDSLILIEEFEKMGINRFIATPHIMNDYYPNTRESINTALEKLQVALKELGKDYIEIKAAAEYMMDQSFLELMGTDNLLCLYQNFVLVEMSYFQAPINLNDILFKLQTQKYRPVLAHPERYVFFHSRNMEKYEELKQRGCLFQLNILSILGHYGSNIQAAALALLDNKMIDFIGTDTHQPRHLEKLTGTKIPQKRIDQLAPILEKTTATFSSCF